MPNTEQDSLSKEQAVKLLKEYCHEFRLLVIKQTEAIKEENFSKLEDYIKEFHQLKTNIDNIRAYLQKYDSIDNRLEEPIKALLQQAAEANMEGIGILKGYINKMKQEMKMINQIGKYVNNTVVSQARIIDKSI